MGQGGLGAGWMWVSLQTEADELFGKNMEEYSTFLPKMWWVLKEAQQGQEWKLLQLQGTGGWFSRHKPWIEG